jgi:epsilon-lactone hydrolase
MSDEAKGLHVPARVIPVPTTVSPEARAFLSHVPPVSSTAMPAPDDFAGWRKQAAAADAMVITISKMAAAKWPYDTVTHQLANAPLYEIVPHNLDPANERRAILYVHGGGFFMGGGEAAILASVPFAGRARCRVFSLDYRMAPEHPFPAGLEDAVDAWRWLLERYKQENMAVTGGSAGGNLAPAMVLKLRDLGLPLPAACAVHSPASDMTEAGDSYETNAVIDTVLQHRLPELMHIYCRDHDRRDPLLSPVFADYSKGFPPTVLTTGTRDLLLSSTVLLHRAMRRGGVKAELHVFEAMTHAPFFGAPEELELQEELVSFMLAHMGSD